jgi:hypothetical protein
MNTLVIVLGIIIVILVYILYKYFTNTSISLQSQAALTNQVSGITVKNPQSTRYAYGIWVYVNSWDSTIYHVIFNRNNNILVYLDVTSPTLICEITMTTNGTQPSGTQKMIITDNFPLQKWVNIVISVDNQFVDAYLDGKLIQSMRMYSTTNNSNGSNTITLPIVPPDVNTQMYVGNSDAKSSLYAMNGNTFKPWDAYITKFKQWSSAPIDPQTAWNYYMDGNGSNPIASYLGNYGASIQIMKNNVENSKLTLF